MTIELVFDLPRTAEFTATAEAPADAPADAPERRTITGPALPLGVPSGRAQDGHRYQFDAPPSNLADLVDVVREHDPHHVVGRLAAPLEAAGEGEAQVLNASARIFDTTRGRDVLTEFGEGVYKGFSVGADFADWKEDADGVRHVTDWTLRHLGIVRRPAFSESTGLQIAASAYPEQENPTMPTAEVLELPTIDELAQQVAAQLAAQEAAPTHPLATFASFADYVTAVMDAEDDDAGRLQAAFALVDQTTADNPGLVPPGWRNGIKANLDARRPAINAFGGPIPLPESGMESNWPYFDGDLDALIKKQTTEKTELNSVKVSIKKASEPILTAGAASDISYQLLRRSSPAYRAAYLNILMAAWARYTEAQFEAALEGRGTWTGEALGTTAEAIRGQLFGASSAVEDATGAPAEVVLVAGDLWETWGALEGLHNPKYGTRNAAGTADASTLTIEINGLPVKRAPFLSDGVALASNSSAAKFPETGPMVATEEDVAKLGQNVAVWGMYEDAEVYFPAGVVLLGVEPVEG